MKIERCTTIFDRLGELSVVLPQDPTDAGPNHLAELASQCRGYLNEVSFYLQEVMSETVLLDRQLNLLETDFRLKADTLLTENKAVSELPSLTDRQAKINIILSVELAVIDGIKATLRDNANVEKVVRMRLRELDNTMSTIRLQKSLITTNINSGAYLGDTSDAGRGGDVLTTSPAKKSLVVDDEFFRDLDLSVLGLSESTSTPSKCDEPQKVEPSLDHLKHVTSDEFDPVLDSDEVLPPKEDIPLDFQEFMQDSQRLVIDDNILDEFDI